MAVCIALTACAGSAMAVVVAFVAWPPLLLVFDIAFRATRDDPPFRWLEPMYWLLPASALVGACAGAVLAWLRLHASARGPAADPCADLA